MCSSSDTEFVTVLRARRNELKQAIELGQQELAHLRSEFKRHESEMSDRLELLEKESQYVEGLLVLRDGSGMELVQGGDGEGQPARSVQDIVHAMLQREGEGLHYSEIVKRLAASGILLGGANAGATLISRLTGDKRFARPKARGVYALREWNPNASDVGTRKRRKARKRVQRSV